MNKNKKLLYIFVFLVVSIFTIQFLDIQAFADVGNTFSGGGSSSSGSSGSSGSYSSSGYSSGGGGVFWIFYFFAEVIPFPINIILIVLILGAIYKTMFKNQGVMNSEIDVQPVPQMMEDDVVSRVRQNDANFSKNQFVNYVNTVFIKVQEAWEDREWSVIRPFESNELFERHSEQLNEYIENKLYPHLDRQEILSTILANHYKDNKYEYITVKLTANVIDFTTNENDEVIEGSKTDFKFRMYKLNFKRINGVLTKEEGGTSVTNCPKCGAPNSITSSGKCEFCSSVITTGEYGWVLDEYSQWRD